MAMNVKWKYEPYAFYNKKGIEDRLGEMAEQGWFIEKMGFFWKYRKGTPAKRTYNVVYMEDPEDDAGEERQQEFVDYCETAGWNRCFAKKCMLIFYHESENPVPIETECEFAVKNIHKAMKSVYLQRYLSVILLAVMYIVQLWMKWRVTPFNLLSANYTLFFAAYILMGLLLLLDAAVYYHWRRKAFQQISDDETELPIAENKIQRIIVDWSPIMVILIALGILLLDKDYGGAAIIGVFFVLFYIIYKFDEWKRNNVFHDVVKRKRKVLNINQPWGFILIVGIGLVLALMVVCITILSSISEKEDEDNIELSPVTYEDLYVVETCETSNGSYYENDSFLFKDVYFDQWIESPVGQGYTAEKYFGYRYVEVKLERMYDFAFEKYCEQENINLKEYTVVNQAFGKNRKIYQMDDQCVILWDDAFAEIYFNGVPDNEEIKFVADKLEKIE